MKLPFGILSGFCALSIVIGSVLPTAAQSTITNSMTPVVTVVASDPSASEAGDPGLFTIQRSGPTNTGFRVFFALRGSASNGVDYQTIEESIEVPPGVLRVPIPVKPIDDSIIEGVETVNLHLVPSPILAPIEPYRIGFPSNAVVSIEDNDRNFETNRTVVNIVATDAQGSEIPVVPPGMGIPQRYDPAVFTVTRSGPTNFALTVFLHIGGTAQNGIDYTKVPESITIPEGARSADIIIDPIDDSIAEPTESVEIAIVPPMCTAIYPPPPECYMIGLSGRAVAFILDDDTPTGNLPPSVTITRPPNGAVFRSPADIHIEAVAVDRDGYCSFMEFFANSNKIGEVTLNFFVEPPPGQAITFGFDWKDVQPGNYILTARATDNEGATGVSQPVRISVSESNPPPQTNLTVVSIVATDPYASEGPIYWVTTSTGGMEPMGTTLLRSNDWLWRTNLVPVTNTATFTIRREGPTNSSLRVYYEIGGTASNGVDYLKLSGVAEIPAGHRATRVVVVPIDDNIPEPIESVVLSLRLPPLPLADGDSPYTLGFSRRAAAIIADNDQPRPPLTCLRDGIFHVCQPGTNGFCYRIEATTNLSDWTVICTNRVLEGAVQYVDPDAPGLPVRFYRVLPAECPPEDN